jgi:hypothetical protein
MLKRIGSIVLAAASMAACSESMVPTEPAVPTGTTQAPQAPLAADQTVLAKLTCRVDVAANSMSCAPNTPTPVAGRSDHLILGGQNTYVKLANTVPVNNGTTITATLTVQNLTTQPWGTFDGGYAEPDGVMIFFLTPPTSPVTVNAPFTGTFTDVNQKYFQYSGLDLGADGILSPGETSLGQSWVFTLNGASTFTFQVLIATAVPDEEGVLRWFRSTAVSTPGYFNSVWGSSASDVWAGGKAGSLSHWNGTAWSNVATSAPSDVNAIWGSSASDVYAVGNNGEIQRYNGSAWNYIGYTGSTTYGVWGSSASDVWLVGVNGMILHSAGDDIFAYYGLNLSAPPTFAAVWGTGPTNVYAVGADKVARYDGSSGQDWQYVDISAALVGGEDLRSVWGSSAADIWVGGTNGTLLHSVNGVWTRENNLGSAVISSMSGTSDTDVYATSDSGQIWHYNGIGWVAVNNANSVLNGVWSIGNRDVWAVGTVDYNSNLVLHGVR